MIKNILLAAALSATSISGCATQSIQQRKDLSSSAIVYSDAVDKLLDITTDRIIDFDTDELIKTRRGTDPRLMINQKNEALIAIIEELTMFRYENRILKIYFLNLQALADSPAENEVGATVKSLSDSMSKLNETLTSKGGKEKLTDKQINQIGALGGLVANRIYAEKVKHVLERDAEIIGTYLALQERQLENIGAILQDRFVAGNDLFLNEKVISPYVDKKQVLGPNWANDRKQWLKAQFIDQQLATAKEAAKELRGVWEDILQGKTDINSMSVLINDINEFAITVHALELVKTGN